MTRRNGRYGKRYNRAGIGSRGHCTHMEQDGNIYKVCCPEKPFGTPWGQTCQYWLVSEGGISVGD